MSIYKLLNMSIYGAMMHAEPKTTEEFLSRVGRVEFQKWTGFTAQRVQRAKDENVFPAVWFWKVREFCQSHAMETPEHLFRGHPSSSPAGAEQ